MERATVTTDKAVAQRQPERRDISGVFVAFKAAPSFRLAVWIIFFRPRVATIGPNWLVLIVQGGGTFDISIKLQCS